MKEHQGFTLVELLVTLSVLAILLTIGVPAFSNFVASSQLTSQTNDLLGAVAFGRSEAIRRNQSVVLCRAERDASSCTRGDEWHAWLLLVDDEVLRRGDIDSRGQTLSVRSDLPDDRAVFLPDGMTSLDSGALVSDEQIVVCTGRLDADNRRTLALSPAGDVTTYEATATC